MSEKIISLCYVSKRNDKSTELCRFADLVNDEFVQYTFIPGNDFRDTERDLIYGPTAMLQAEVESIGVYEWSTYLSAAQEWRTETRKASDVSWCEVVYTKCVTIDQLIQALKSGYPVDKYDRLHDIILCCSPVDNECDAVYIYKSDTTYHDGKIGLLESVDTLRRYKLDVRYATGECKCRYSFKDTRKYLARKKACQLVGYAEVKTRNQILSEIMKQCIGKDALGRKERQAARLALDKLSIPSAVDMIASRFQCSSGQAQKYAEDYIAQTREKLDSTTSQRLIEMLVENDSEATQRMRAAVQKQWEETEQERIKGAQQRQAEATQAFEAIQKQITDAELLLRETQVRQVEAQSKAEKALAFQQQIETKIQERLEVFKTDYASALMENVAFASVALSLQQKRIDNMSSPKDDSWTISFPENSTSEGMIEDNIDSAVDSWSAMCVNPNMACGLTIMTFAAYAKQQPLLIVGEGAILTADLISATICGQPAIKVHANDEVQDYHKIMDNINKNPKAVICFINGLKAGYDQIRELMYLYPQRMIIITEMHEESLAMEPSSLYSVFLPVLCDYFYTGKQVEELPIYDCSQELFDRLKKLSVRNLQEAKVAFSQWFHGSFYPPAMRERYANLLAAMNLMAQFIGLNSSRIKQVAIEFVFVPLLKCMRKEELLKTQLEESTVLDSYLKSTLINFIGTEE